VAGGKVVVVVTGGRVVVVVVAAGSNCALGVSGDDSVFPVAEQLLRAYVGTGEVVQPGWVLALISVILLEPVESASELAFSTACIRVVIVPDVSQIALP
jgi:hypothetical protein